MKKWFVQKLISQLAQKPKQELHNTGSITIHDENHIHVVAPPKKQQKWVSVFCVYTIHECRALIWYENASSILYEVKDAHCTKISESEPQKMQEEEEKLIMWNRPIWVGSTRLKATLSRFYLSHPLPFSITFDCMNPKTLNGLSFAWRCSKTMTPLLSSALSSHTAMSFEAAAGYISWYNIWLRVNNVMLNTSRKHFHCCAQQVSVSI